MSEFQVNENSYQELPNQEKKIFTAAEEEIIRSTNSKIRSFLYELKEGVTNYRSLHSLTEQVEHQYHGRFLVELIQNAHDALSTSNYSNDHGRIEIFLKKDEEDFGVLYIGNDGSPFSKSNFTSLSQLGQSDKNPQESIGNKGIGFRSVLEVTNSPEIYSRAKIGNPTFDGYCFSFSQKIIKELTTSLFSILDGQDSVTSPLIGEIKVDWPLSKLREKIKHKAEQEKMDERCWIEREMRYLSPYFLPISLSNSDKNTTITEYENRGFSSLIRLPLKNLEISKLITLKIEELNSSTILFLERVSTLVLHSGNELREYSRTQTKRLNGHEVIISDVQSSTSDRYWVWKREINLTGNAFEYVQKALGTLPGKWPLLKEATISIGVAIEDNPESGMLSIFLPTLLDTGCAAHINAPFFGDMSRTHIDFGDTESSDTSGGAVYNRFLLRETAQLTLSVINNDLAGKGIDEAKAIIDMLSPYGHDTSAIERWQRLINEAEKTSEIKIVNQCWALSDHGWDSFNKVFILPQVSNSTILNSNIIRRHAKFSPYIKELDCKKDAITRLYDKHHISSYPQARDVANTLESIAVDLHKQTNIDWNGFWSDVTDLFKNRPIINLIDRKIILGNDGQLYSSSKNCLIYFVPRRTQGDEEELYDAKEIPPTLRKFVAFVHDNIHIKNGLYDSSNRKFLQDAKLVHPFRRETVLRDILVKRTPLLPVSLDSDESALCKDILLWGLGLMTNQQLNPEHDKTLLRLLEKLPVPCIGGWYPLVETSFGEGWPDTQGSQVHNYLYKIDTPSSTEARNRLLLPPTHPYWNKKGEIYRKILLNAGVSSGIRLIKIGAESWGSQFGACPGNFHIPSLSPPHCSQNDWDDFKREIDNSFNLSYSGWFKYSISTLYTLPGLDNYRDFDTAMKKAFMDVVLSSICNWSHGWEELIINKDTGQYYSKKLKSPLKWILENMNWIGIPVEKNNKFEWYRPSERWHVPTSELSNRREWLFSYLKPLPYHLARQLDMNPALAKIMCSLKMPSYSPENKSDNLHLIEALINAVENNEIPHRDVFLGQVRAAWSAFEPSNTTKFPTHLLVQKGKASLLTVEKPSKIDPVYLPDSSKSFLTELRSFELPIIAIDKKDAERLANYFTVAYPNAVYKASTLKPLPLFDREKTEPTQRIKLQDNEKLGWTIPIILTIAAFDGVQSRGTTTQAFKERIHAFQEANIDIVNNLRIALYRDTELVIDNPLPAPALWQHDKKTLFINAESITDISTLSEAFSNIIGRDDLEIQIKFVFSLIGKNTSRNNIIKALEQIKLSETNYDEVCEYWKGSVSLLIRKIAPLIRILYPDLDIENLMQANTDDAVTGFIDQLNDARLDGYSLVKMAENSPDTYSFGYKAYKHLGESINLRAWNLSLISFGDRPVKNIDAYSDFKRHIGSITPILRTLIAKLSSRHKENEIFQELSGQIRDMKYPVEFENSLWEVNCQLILQQTIPLFEKYKINPNEVRAIEKSNSIEQLLESLKAEGVDTESDPLQVARDNKEKLSKSLLTLKNIRLAWAVKKGIESNPEWDCKTENWSAELLAIAKDTVYSNTWGEDYIWTLIENLKNHTTPTSSSFWSTLEQSKGFVSLCQLLELSQDDISCVEEKVQARREEAQRKKRLINVCGKEYDNLTENLSGLWTHITDALPHDSLKEIIPIDLSTTTPLDKIIQKAKPQVYNQTQINNRNSTPKYSTRSLERLIGLSGEIHAFRMLQQRYGTSIVSSSSWVSSNSAVIGLNTETDDSKGCDFVVALQGYTYYIEVKSTEGYQETFTMGSSEIRLAMHLAKPSNNKQKEVFMVLRVSNALANPSFQLLPNPYDPDYHSCYKIEEADARVTYKKII